jgi:hypothetical protein
VGTALHRRCGLKYAPMSMPARASCCACHAVSMCSTSTGRPVDINRRSQIWAACSTARRSQVGVADWKGEPGQSGRRSSPLSLLSLSFFYYPHVSTSTSMMVRLLLSVDKMIGISAATKVGCVRLYVLAARRSGEARPPFCSLPWPSTPQKLLASLPVQGDAYLNPIPPATVLHHIATETAALVVRCQDSCSTGTSMVRWQVHAAPA